MKQEKKYYVCEICFAKHHFEEEAEICEGLHKSNKDDVYKVYQANLEIARKCREESIKEAEVTQIINGEKKLEDFLTPIPDPFADLVREREALIKKKKKAKVK